MYFPPFSYSFPFFSFFFFFLCCAACFLLFYFLRHVLRCLVSFNRWWPDSKETTPNNPLALVLSIPRDHCVLLLFDSSSVWRVAKRKKIIKTKTKRQRTTQQGYTYIPSSTFILYRPSITLSLFRLSLSLSLSLRSYRICARVRPSDGAGSVPTLTRANRSSTTAKIP